MTDTVRLPRVSRKSPPAPDPCEATVDVFTDPVSGVASSAYFARELRREYARCRRYEHPLAVIVCDIDRLKLINGGFGHAAGDAALRAFGTRATRSVRTSDWIGRKAGDEFVVVLPETDLAGAAVLAERIRRAMTDRPVTSGKSTFTVTLSIGYSALESATELARFGAADLLETAEQQLALSARNGGNGATGAPVVRAHQPTPPKSPTRSGLTQVTAPMHLSLIEDRRPTPDRPVRSHR
ncbi:MAG: GGDEF domain-containing protein [Steroidobacteraceae bacterium]